MTDGGEFSDIGEWFKAAWRATVGGDVDPRLVPCDPGPPLTESEIAKIEDWADSLLDEPGAE